MKLNAEQKIAVEHFNGPALVVSCPGSGKTSLLVERTARLIERGIKPSHILCMTFTNKAAGEMKNRIKSRIGSGRSDFFIGTFHSLCALLLRQFGSEIGYTSNFTILDSDDQIDVVLQVGRKMGLSIDKKKASKIAWAINDVREKILPLDYLEELLINENSQYIPVARQYIKTIKNMNCIDFTGLLSEIVRLMKTVPSALQKLQSRWEYVQVDECQDCNIAQFEFINMLTAIHNNIMLIGDISQSIYKFRGARYQNINDFLKKHIGCYLYHLSENYRSTPQIIAVADKLIKHNKSHMGQKFSTTNPSGHEVIAFAADDQDAEAHMIAARILSLVEDKGYEFNDFAIFYRINSMAQPFETIFPTHGIKHRTIGGFSFYNRAEIKDSMAMLRFLVNPTDGVAFERIANKMTGISTVRIGQIENYAEEKQISIVQACRDASNFVKSNQALDSWTKIAEIFSTDMSKWHTGQCLSHIAEKLNYHNYLQKKYDDHEDRWNNVHELVNSAAIFGEKEPSVAKYLQNIALLTSEDKSDNKDNAVTLMTLHAAKGLEFPIVFMVGVEDKKLPHIRSIEEDSEGGVEEERRLCYVGMTRAKKILHISYCEKRKMFSKYGLRYVDCTPSQFLFESGVMKSELFY